MALILDPILLDIIEFDVLTDESWSDSVEWTEHPVESGLAITDHGIRQPTEVTLSGVFTDTPLTPAPLPVPDRAKQAYDRLLEMMERREIVTVITGLRVHESMGVAAVDKTKDVTTGRAVIPVVTLREIRIVNSVSIPIPPAILAAAQKPGGQSDVDAGVQSPPAPSDVTSEAASGSLGTQIVDSALGSSSLADVIGAS
jgi:hypothetical protein